MCESEWLMEMNERNRMQAASVWLENAFGELETGCMRRSGKDEKEMNERNRMQAVSALLENAFGELETGCMRR